MRYTSAGAPRRRLPAALLAVLLACALAAPGCDSGGKARSRTSPNPAAASPGERPVRGGVVAVALDDEPSSLNAWTPSGANNVTATVTGPVLAQLAIYKPDFSYAPQLLAELPELVSEVPPTVRYRLRRDAVWEDGTPITAADVQYTLDQILNPGNAVASREGYELIKDGKLVDVSTDGRAFSIVFTSPYGAWRELFTSPRQPILKAAAMQGQNFDAALADTIPFASGPYKIESWTKGQGMVLVRNDKYWGPKPYLDKIVFRFVESGELQVAAMQTGEVQAAYQVRRPELGPAFRSIQGLVVQTPGGPLWEHLDFNLQDSLVGIPEVRQAIAYVIDREAIADIASSETSSRTSVLQNVMYMPNQPEYMPNWRGYRPDTARASELLRKAGFVKGGDGVWAKGDQRLSIKVATTAGNRARDNILRVIKDNLTKFGIEMTVDALAAADLFTRVPNCEYQVALYASEVGPDPINGSKAFRADQISCPGENQNADGDNSTAYRNIEVTELINKADAELDPRKRARFYNQADQQIAKDVPVLPLFQKPTVLASVPMLRDIVANSTIEGPTWNVGEWWLRRAKTPSPTPAASPTRGR
jgi:peptide/nickel transport system substrate-binding protein